MSCSYYMSIASFVPVLGDSDWNLCACHPISVLRPPTRGMSELWSILDVNSVLYRAKFHDDVVVAYTSLIVLAF